MKSRFYIVGGRMGAINDKLDYYKMKLEDVKKLEIPKEPGSYQFYNDKGEVVYVGKAVDLRSRVLSYFRSSTKHTVAKKRMVKEIENIAWEVTETEIEALLLEANLIKKLQPFYNIDKRDDKRFSYIKISTEDEIPGIFVTRKIDKSGKYFGPFTSAIAVRETLKAIRKIWPYCTERKLKKKICFYAQIGRCVGVCGGQFDLAEYKEKVIKPIEVFLKGKKKLIIKNYELRITKLEKELAKKKLGEQDEKILELKYLKFQLMNMQNVLAHARIISVTEKYAADVVELAKVLGLAKVPERIEGYDISNIFGSEAVGSMVVFSGGEPDKSQYRKFKIKIGDGKASDTGMLREVLERRFLRLGNDSGKSLPLYKGEDRRGSKTWPDPDLIVVDGGKAQLNVGFALLKKYNLDIPIIAISKGKGLRSGRAPDKLFFPGEKKPLELPLSSPALHILKRVRDESHRFAIKYHRELRRKSLFG